MNQCVVVLSTKIDLPFFCMNLTLIFLLPIVFLKQTFSNGEGLWGVYFFEFATNYTILFFRYSRPPIFKRKITVLFCASGDGWCGGPLSPLGLRGQPDVVERVRVQPVQDVLVADGQAAVILVLKSKIHLCYSTYQGLRKAELG